MPAGDLITGDGQLEWAGILLGSGTAYRWEELTGWDDLPGLDSGNVPRPQRHGAWPGRYLAQERIVTYTAKVRTEPGAYGAAVTGLRAATVVQGDDTELPLVVRTRDGETLLAYGMVTGRVLPNTQGAGIGRGTATIQWTCTDPRRYSLGEHVETIPQPAPGVGLTYPLVYPLNYGAAAETGDRTLTNSGDTPTSPVLGITGPCTTPAVTLAASGAVLEFDLVLGAGEVLTVDTGAGTVLLNGTADRSSSLSARSVPLEAWELPPGDSTVSFRAQSFGGGSECSVTWRDAWM